MVRERSDPEISRSKEESHDQQHLKQCMDTMLASKSQKQTPRWLRNFVFVLIGLIPLFSISQKILWPLLSILLLVSPPDRGYFLSHKNASSTIKQSLTWSLTGLAFMLLAARNAFNDINSGLIHSQGELSASLARTTLYILAPLAIYLVNRRSILSITNSAQALFAGLQLKVAVCFLLTPIITGDLARKGFLLQFPTLKVDVSTWTGTYFLLSAGLACLFLRNNHNTHQGDHFKIGLLAYATGAGVLSAYALQNLSCTVASLILMTLLAKSSLEFSTTRTTTASQERPGNRIPSGITGRITMALVAALVATLLIAKDSHFVEELRIKQLLSKNDRLEFLVQGAKRLPMAPISSNYLLDGPPQFQRPICFKAEEVTFTVGNSCHNYWHTILWDSLRNSGYAGLGLAAMIIIALSNSLYRAAVAHENLVAAAICCCLFIIFTTPIVEVGAGEVLPLMLLITLIAEAQSIRNPRRFRVDKPSISR